MKKIKIIAPKGMTAADIEEYLESAVELKKSEKVHMTESFEDPAMIDLSERVIAEFTKQYDEMLTEISAVLEKEYE